MSGGRAQRRYAILALVFGVPGLAGGGALSLFGIVLSVFGPHYMSLSERLLTLAFGLAGAAAPAGWLWLSVVYLRRGRDGLRHAGVLPWIGLLLGLLTGLFVLATLLWHWQDGGRQTVALVLAGLLLAVPAAALAAVRWPRAPGLPPTQSPPQGR
jgi:hypothetical protein